MLRALGWTARTAMTDRLKGLGRPGGLRRAGEQGVADPAIHGGGAVYCSSAEVHGWDWPRKMPTFITSPHRYGIECCTLRAAAAPRLDFGSLGVLP